MYFTDSRGNQIKLPQGKSVSWRISGYAILQNKNKFLMIKSGNGLWHFPGGGIEQGESIQEGVIRELLEETGYYIIPDVQPHHLNEQKFYHTSKDEFYNSIQLFYKAQLQNQNINESAITKRDKERERKWIAIDEINLEVFHPTVRKLISKLIEAKS